MLDMKKTLSLEEFIDLDELQAIQNSFARAVGISSVILSPEGKLLTKFTDPTGFCSLIQSTEKGKDRCFRSFMEMEKIAFGSEKSEIFYCFAHGGHFVSPIMIDGEHRGTMFAGQFIPVKFSTEQLQNLEEIAIEIDLDPGLLRKEAEKMRVVGEDVILNYSILLFKIVETIARRGAQALELSRVNDALQVAHDDLERRVLERTVELAEANKELKHEIVERKSTEEALRESEGKLSAMLQSLGDHISMVDKDLNILWANDVAKGLFGDDIIGKKCYKVYHGRNKPCEPFPCITLKAFEDEQLHEHETMVQTRAGQTLQYACTANVAIRDDEGRPVAVIEISRDITECKLAEKELLKRMNELETFYRATLGREERVIELKQEVNELLEQLGKNKKYRDYSK
jgi:PAS domain S-box-containing protein